MKQETITQTLKHYARFKAIEKKKRALLGYEMETLELMIDDEQVKALWDVKLYLGKQLHDVTLEQRWSYADSKLKWLVTFNFTPVADPVSNGE